MNLTAVAREVLEQAELDRSQPQRLPVTGDGLVLGVDHERSHTQDLDGSALVLVPAQHGFETQRELPGAE